MSSRVSASEKPVVGARSLPNATKTIRRQGPLRLTVIACSAIAMGLVLFTSFAVFRRAGDSLGPAREHFEAGNFRLCLRQVQQHLKSHPRDRDGALLAARCLSRLGMPGAAEDYYAQGQPVDHDDLQDRAYGLILIGRPEKSVELYSEIIDRWPQDVLALKRLAAVLMQTKQWKRCRGIAEMLTRISESQVAGYTLAGIAHHESKNAAAAADAFETVLRLDPDLRDMPLPRTLFWNNLALDLIALGRTSEARGHLEKAVDRHQSADLMELIGVTFEKDGRFDRAEACWRRALEWDPDHTNSLLGLGRLALSRKQWAEAVHLLEKAVALAPNSVEPAYELSQAYRFSGDLTRATRLAARAETLRRSQPPRGGMGEMADGAQGDPADRPLSRNFGP